MASVTLTIVGAAGGAFGELSTTFSITDDDSDRVLAFIVATHGRNKDGTERTPQQAVDAFAETLLVEHFTKLRTFERQSAAATAVAAVSDIPYQRVTP